MEKVVARIKIIAIYSLISGIFSVFIGAIMLTGQEPVNSSYYPNAYAFFILSLITAITGILEIITCYGLWTFQKWGHTLAKYLYFLYIPLGLVLILLDSSTANFATQSVFIILSAIIVLYLVKPEVLTLYR